MMTTHQNPPEVDLSLHPGPRHKPIMTEQTARELIKSLYGLQVDTLIQLDSYIDKNYKVTVLCDYTNPNIAELWPHGYVLKVLNSLDSLKEHADAEHEAQTILRETGISCPQVVLDLMGREKSLQTIYHESNGSLRTTGSPSTNPVHLVRLFTFLPGDVMDDLPVTSPHLFVEVGELLARVDQALTGFRQVGLSTHDHFIWNMVNTASLRVLIPTVVTDPSRRLLVEDVITSFQKDVLTNLDKYEKGAIHGDFNHQNLVVERDSSSFDSKCHISGVIDFGHLMESFYLFELAICIAYMSIASKGLSPLLSVGGHVLAGYLRQRSLADAEWRGLKECICARYCQTLVMGAYFHSSDPTNECILNTSRVGWDQLKILWGTPRDQLYAAWQEIIRGHNPDIELPDLWNIVD